MSEHTGDQVLAVAASAARLRAELGKVIVGQSEVIEQIIITMLAGGHALLTGVPGLGKTLLVKSIAQLFSLSFKRIQFTPDLMPADIFGTEVMDEDSHGGGRGFRFIPGPVFANLVLADEINRTPPKTQAALLEAMGEGHVTAGGQTHELSRPFFVLATQNPIELEGTYPLPEAQLDRFLLNIVMDYLPLADEERMVKETTSPDPAQLAAVLSGEEVIALQRLVREVPVSDNVVSYAVRLCAATRPRTEHAAERVNEMVQWGAGSRASQALILAGKARALLAGRRNVACEDVRELALPVLRHRVITNFRADAEGLSSEQLIRDIIAAVAE
ncbi:AAA family ATPase [Oligosphaera ethanolica]|uniref:MoxR-like ATPase n=1 Tax=Oligosphaera ethanolica TaxID=760260 RepID=A0AAE4AP96_9BACT|nr:MoxR family ATPase [Oligosphaera ethanolica]MDQ0290471.1 MoxR-like ATPase [Oligosphaera ethanolica]